MTTITERPATDLTIADLLDRFGPIAFGRIRSDPPPGEATEEDVQRIRETERRLYELVDGILLEKVMGYDESVIAIYIGAILLGFAHPRRLGLIAGEAGMMKLAPGLVRIPDVSFVGRDRLPGGKSPGQPIPDLVPDLAVEVLSPGNTKREMDRKLLDYFEVGVRLVWYVDPPSRTVRVFTAPDQSTTLGEGAMIEGGAVLPGFESPVRSFFDGPALPEPPPRAE